MYATQEEATCAALETAVWDIEPGQSVTMVVVRDEVAANTEGTPDRPFFYCPAPAVSILHRHGQAVEAFELHRPTSL